LDSSCNVDGVAGHRRTEDILSIGSVDDNKTGMNTHPDAEFRARFPQQSLPNFSNGLDNAKSSLDRAPRIVFVRGGISEIGEVC
jgi:hypothetical protein